MLDEPNILNRGNIISALTIAADQIHQLNINISILNKDRGYRPIKNILIIVSDESITTGKIIKTWLGDDLTIPLELYSSQKLPNYVDTDSLIIFCDYGGGDIRVNKCLLQSIERGSQIAVISSGGDLIKTALLNNIVYIPLLIGLSKKPSILYEVKAIALILDLFDVISIEKIISLVESYDFLKTQTNDWMYNISTNDNFAKQIASLSVGKSAVFYSGPLSDAISDRFVVDFSNNSRNVAFSSVFPDFGNAEYCGWLSHPVEKPFVVFNVISNFEPEYMLSRVEEIDRLLSGRRPKSHDIVLAGNSIIEQLLCGVVLSSFVSVYLAALNNVSPFSNK